MAELTPHEFWVLKIVFSGMPYSALDRTRVELQLSRLSYNSPRSTLDALVRKNVLSSSPDGRGIRFTDYGLELYKSMEAAQRDWQTAPIIKVSSLDRDQIAIRAGETFKANRILREIFGHARSELAIVDNYVGEKLFDLLEPFAAKVKIRIMTVTDPPSKTSKIGVAAYKDFRTQYSNCEMRSVNGPHDRYILWDHTAGFHCGHSLQRPRNQRYAVKSIG